MNREQNRDLAIQWGMVCRKLKGSGIDLSHIKIATHESAARNSYITRRIMEGLKNGYQV